MLFDVSNVGKREVVDEARASELLKPLVESTEMVESICLSNKSYTRESAAVVAAHLMTVANAGRFEDLKTVNIADVIAGRPEDEALEVLRILCSPFAGLKNITTIDVSDNAFGAKGLDASAILLEGRSQMVSLKACNNGISEASTKQLCDLILASGCELKTFHFFNNMSGPGGAKEIAAMLRDPKLAGLLDLRFSGTRAQAEGTKAVISSIAEGGNYNFIKLDLNDNTFQDEGAFYIAKSITSGRFHQLQSLLLRDGSLGPTGVTTVCKAISSSSLSLVELDLSGNEIGDGVNKIKTMKSISQALISLKQTLNKLFIEDNELGSKMVLNLTQALCQCLKLEKLQLRNNEIRGETMLTIVKSLLSASDNLNLPLLQSKGGLELDGNYLTASHVETLQSLLEEAGVEGCLGSLEDNNDDSDDQEEDDDDDDEEEEEQEEQEQGGAEDVGVSSLSSNLASMSVNKTADELLAMKKAVGYYAVDTYVKSGMRVGLGTGSTATFVVDRLAEKLSSGELTDCIGYPTSVKTLEQAQSVNIPLGTLNDLQPGQMLDVCIDGADSVDSNKQLVKGGGGALLREKMVALASNKFIIVGDVSKKCDKIGTHFMVPVEITPFSHKRTIQLINALPSVIASSGQCILRLGSAGNNKVDGNEPAVTDNGNYMVDIKFDKSVIDPRLLAQQISSVVGVVEHGLFIDMAHVVLFAENDGLISTL
jgi:ribose 5-phosphate isomerase A